MKEEEKDYYLNQPNTGLAAAAVLLAGRGLLLKPTERRTARALPERGIATVVLW